MPTRAVENIALAAVVPSCDVMKAMRRESEALSVSFKVSKLLF